jgi:hypothetical protein
MADLQDPQSLDNRRLSSIARNPNHPLHTHAKAEMDRRKVKRKEMGEGAMKRIATTQASKTDRIASTDKKGLETFKKKPTTEADAFGRLGITSPTMKHIDKKLDKVTKRTQTVMNKRPRSTMEEKDPEEYDNEGSMMKSQLRQIASANEKLMSMVKDDDNLPEWVQSKVTKATDYIRSVRDYLESEKMEEKTLTPAELKKREKIAKAIERDNPDMPMDKKMAIATATAKRVAEGKAYGPTGVSYYVPSGHKDEVNPKTGEKYPERQKPGYKNPSEQKVDELKKSTLASYIKKASDDRAKNAYDIGKSGKINYKGLKRRQGINRAVNKMANEENIDEVLDTPKAMQSYKDKAKYSKDRATSSAAAKILRGPDASGKRADHSPELKTMNKRDKGLKMADKSAMRKTFKALRTAGNGK